ncbi:MAG: NAD-dependent epimerase/dehydratase family protein [Bacteroidetes bacterium]|nr:NAD-dependent epimerase/dehydratase family protein [Bacteroidota bacterium]
MVLVTGANGFLGAYVVQALLANGEHVRCLVRTSSNLQLLQPFLDQIELVYGDVLDIPSLEVAMDGVEYVYHAAAVVSFDKRKRKMLYKTNIEGTANVVNVCMDKGVKKLCHVSSVAALGGFPEIRKEELIDEETKWDPEHTTSYGISQYHGELEIQRGIAEGLKAVIVNPAMIFGSGDWKTGNCRLIEQVHQGFQFYTPGGNGVVDARDVADAMIVVMKSQFEEGEKFVLVGENKNFKDLFFDIASNLGVKPPYVKAQRWMLDFYLVFDWIKSRITGHEALITRESANYSFETYSYSSAKIKKLCTFQFRPYEQTISETIQAYLTSFKGGNGVKVLHI